MKHQSGLVFTLLGIAGLVLSACQSSAVVQTVQVTREVKMFETQVVEKTRLVEVAATSFTTPDPILSDVKVRQAMAYCTNKNEIAGLIAPLLSEEEASATVINSFLPANHWAYAGSKLTFYNFDPEKGRALLEEAGWKVTPGSLIREKDGVPLAVKFTLPDDSIRRSWGAAWVRQMGRCGLLILPSYVPESWLFGEASGLQVRDFSAAGFAWVGSPDPDGQSLYACNQIPLLENHWTGQNITGWCNGAASDAVNRANNTLLKEERAQQYAIVQQQFTRDVPSIPLVLRTDFSAANPRLEGYQPVSGEEFYTYNIGEWRIPDQDSLVVGLTQEPDTLYPSAARSFSSKLVMQAVDPDPTTSLNNEYQAVTVKRLSTIENGLAKNMDVQVQAGDKVVDASGNVVELRAGVRIVDESGVEIEYKDGLAVMKQLVVTYLFRDDLKWPDGQPLSQTDFELGYQVACDRTGGAVSYRLCEQVSKIEFNGTATTVTWLAGVQNPTYFLPPFGYAPAHRKIESAGEYQGMTLAEVPAPDWPDLPEVARTPWGVGPYQVTGWERGRQITLEANPYWYGGTPAAKKITLDVSLTAGNALDRLLGGQVDLLGAESFSGSIDQIKEAVSKEQIKLYAVPGTTWEHIDLNLFIR